MALAYLTLGERRFYTSSGTWPTTPMLRSCRFSSMQPSCRREVQRTIPKHLPRMAPYAPVLMRELISDFSCVAFAADAHGDVGYDEATHLVWLRFRQTGWLQAQHFASTRRGGHPLVSDHGFCRLPGSHQKTRHFAGASRLRPGEGVLEPTDQKPAIIIQCGAVEDVLAALRVAQTEGLAVAVKSTGHGAVLPCDGGLLFDTPALMHMAVHSNAGTAALEAGVRRKQSMETLHRLARYLPQLGTRYTESTHAFIVRVLKLVSALL